MNETLPGRSAATSFYKSGGTLSPDEPSYVARSADTELHDRLSEGEFCYVLTSRQMGKSSLMNRVSTRLHDEGTVVAEIDLTTIGQNLTIDQWYDGLIYEIGRRANVKAQLRATWQANADLGPLQRFITTLRDALLTTFSQPVVIFVDEIEVVRSLPFSTDEFFAAIRECYNRRASDPEMRRLTFCLLGMATPPDLIQDPRITPFNIGKRIELTDFTFAEARPLAAGMCDGGRDGERLLNRVLYWTSGQPYLTQRLCQAVAEDPSITSNAGVDALCRKLFLSEQARESEPNLVPLREYVLRSAPDRAAVLDLYQKIRDGRHIPAGSADVNVSILQLAGITRAHNGRLAVKNRIYARVFDRRWVRANMPDAELRRQRAAFVNAFVRAALIFGSITVVAIVFAFIAYRNYRTAETLRRQISDELYVADMNRAEDALFDRHNVDQARSLLADHAHDDMIGFEYGYLWRECNRAYYTINGNLNYVTGVAFSPDGKYVACASIAGIDQIVDVANRKVVHTLNSGNTPFAALAFSPDGRYLATIDIGSIELWDTRTWREARTLKATSTLGSYLTCLSFDKSGAMLAAGATGGESVVYETHSWRAVSTESSKGSSVYSLTFAPATGQLVTAGSDGIVRLWDPRTGKRAQEITGRVGVIRAVAFDAAGRRMAVSGEDNVINVWDARSWRVEHTISTGNETIYTLIFVPLTRELAVGGTNNAVELWDTDTQTLDRQLDGHSQQIRGIACSRDGHWIASASWDRTAKIWDIRREKEIKIPDPLPGNKYLTFSLDGSYVAGLLPNKTVGIWSTSTGTLQAKVRFDSNVVALSLRSNPDVVAIAGIHELTIANWRAGRVLRRFELLPNPLKVINRISLSPDGQSVAIGGERGDIEIWQTFGNHVKTVSTGRTSLSITALAWSMDKTELAAGEHGNSSVRVYSLTSNRAPIELLGHHADISALAFSSTGRELASCSTDATIKLWNLETGREVLTIQTDQPQPYSIAFYRRDLRISLIAEGKTIHTWDSMSAADLAVALKRNSSNSSSTK